MRSNIKVSADAMKLSDSTAAMDALKLAQAGQHELAIALMEDQIGDVQKAQGNTPEVVSLLKDLALIYENSGDLSAAINNYRLALAIQESSLGPSHLETVKTLINIANLQFTSQNFPAVSVKYILQLLLPTFLFSLTFSFFSFLFFFSIYLYLFLKKPSQFPLSFLTNCFCSHFQLSVCVQAFTEYCVILAALTEKLGLDELDPLVANTIFNLALCSYTLGDLESSLEFYKQVLQIRFVSQRTSWFNEYLICLFCVVKVLIFFNIIFTFFSLTHIYPSASMNSIFCFVCFFFSLPFFLITLTERHWICRMLKLRSCAIWPISMSCKGGQTSH
jgi:hypothetical protein